MRLPLLLSFVVTLASGCDSETMNSESSGPISSGSCESTVSADDFGRDCTSDAECIAVFEGPSDAACRECAGAAVREDEYASYVASLGPESCSAGPCGADCVASPGDPAACVAGRCEVTGV